MGNMPKVSVAFKTDNILQDLFNIDGNAALIGTAQQVANQGKVMIVHSLSEAVQAGITLSDEPFAYRHIREFYQELGGNQALYVLLLADTVTMTQMLDSTNTVRANKLIDAGEGAISYLGVFRTPPPSYAAGNDYMDSDVAAAVTAAKSLVQYQISKLRFPLVLIEGRIATEGSGTIYTPSTASNGYAGVVLGSTASDLCASVGMALGRKVKYAAHIKMGKVANGPLSAQQIYIGTKKLSEQNAIVVAAVAETKATATVTITAVGADGDLIWLYAKEPSGAWILLGTYTKVIGDTTVTNVATALKNAINTGTGTHGYTATSNAGVITVTSKAGLGATNNGLNHNINITGTITATQAVFSGGVTARPEQSFQTELFHDKGYLTFMTYPGKAGFYFGRDNMASNDDLRIMAHGAVLFAAAKVAVAVYTEDIESEVRTNADGTILEEDAKHLEDRIRHQALVTLGERISDITPIVDRTVNIITTSTTKIKIRVLPVGYNTYINIELGLTPNNE